MVTARYKTRSIEITTKRPFLRWGVLVISKTRLTLARIDRLMHHGKAIVIQDTSLRMKDSTHDK
ncbi:MAG: ATP-binding protein [Planctomyces sp.]